ncbi:MAG: hypothetical protein ACRC7O_02495 [Fimbriiglobus sp.]
MTRELLFDDHDQRFKALFREFFADFLRLFFAEWAARFDLTRVEWLDSEALPDPPDGPQHVLYLVGKLRAREPVDPDDPSDEWLVLVHIEIESADRTTRLKPRLPGYYVHLSERYGRPVLPIVLYLNVALDGIGEDTVIRRFWNLDVLTFRYLYVGLPGLDAEAHVRGENWLGVALSALMRMPPGRAAELGLEALRRLREAGLTEQQRFLLRECVEAYLPVRQVELERICANVTVEPHRRGAEMRRNITSYDRQLWAEKAESRRTAQLELLEAQLATKFGPLPEESLTVLRGLTDERLREVGVSMLNATSITELGL